MMLQDSCCVTQVLLEPYSRAYYFGHERVSKRYGTEPSQDGCNYKDIKAQCEESFPGTNISYRIFPAFNGCSSWLGCQEKQVECNL